MQDKAFSGLCDPRKVDNFVLLDSEIQMGNYETGLILSQRDAIVIHIFKEPLLKVSSKLNVQNMPPAKNS